jgi:signal transduction histidine kinase/CheY-like chemotaxis protein
LIVPLPAGATCDAGEALMSLWTRRLFVQGNPLVLAWCRRNELKTNELATERSRVRGLVEQLPDGVVVLDSAGRPLFANDVALRMLGRERSQLIGSSLEIAALRDGCSTIDVTGRDGVLRKAEVRMLSAHWEGRPALLAILRDVSDREQAERERSVSEGRFQALFENIASGVVTCRRERDGCGFTVIDVNRSSRRLEDIGTIDYTGRPLQDLLPEFSSPELRNMLELVRSSEGFETCGPRWVETSRKPGWRRYRIYSLPTGEISIVYEDLSAQKRTELAFHEAQRLDAIGKLAGGVAHEFNNTLQTIMAAVEISRLRPEESSCDDLMAMIEGRVRQGRALVQELLLVGRKVVPRREHVDLGTVVRSTCMMLRKVVKENVALVWSIEDGKVPVHCDPRQVDQILLNLVNNAVDAFGEGGRIIVEVRSNEGWAELTVSDDGPGVPADLRDRIFEPFFTTKPGREGAGLGLAVVRGIVEQNEGMIEAIAAPGGGACFRIRMPLQDTREAEPEQTGEEGNARTVHGRGKRLLLVEDEEGPREMLREMLELLGYEVESAVCGEEALELAPDKSFDLVLTDYMLPGIDGRELVSRLRARHPELGVVLMSGYAEDVAILADLEQGALRFIQKPFELSALAEELEQATPSLSAGEGE